MQKPICLVHLVAMHEYTSRIGKMAAIYQEFHGIKNNNGINLNCNQLGISRRPPPTTTAANIFAN